MAIWIWWTTYGVNTQALEIISFFEINIGRIRYRVSQGGHAVPEDKIVSRYYRSLELLIPAIKSTNRAFIFDNSGEGQDQ
jgi:predicted ABC-type ATPase